MKKQSQLVRHSIHVGKTFSVLKVQLCGELLKRLRKYANSREGEIKLLGNVSGFPSAGGWWKFYGNPVQEGRDLKEYCLKRLYRLLDAIRAEAQHKVEEEALATAQQMNLMRSQASLTHRYVLKVLPSRHKKHPIVVKDRTVQAAIVLAFAPAAKLLDGFIQPTMSKLQALQSHYAH